MIKTSVIIVSYKAEEELKRCLNSMPESKTVEVIVIDNNKINRGFGKACNLGAKKAKGKYLMFLNPDCVLKKGAIEALTDKMDDDNSIGIIAPQLLDDAGRAYLSFSRQPDPVSAPVVYSFVDTFFKKNRISVPHWFRGQSLSSEREVGIVSGAAFLIRKSDCDSLGGFDEKFFMYWEEVDLCRRVMDRGKRIVYFPKAKVVHSREKSTPVGSYLVKSWFRHSRFYFFKKHFGLLYAAALETFLVAQEEWRLLLIVALAAFLRFKSLETLLPILGDQGRDFLAALDGLRDKQIPLLGIPSSMPRFKQGPLSVWFLMAIFGFLGKDPVVAGYVYALFGLLAVILTYILAERFWGRKAAVAAALFLAAAPLAVTQSRLVFHTNPIPLFSLVYLWSLTEKPKGRRQVFWVGLAFSLLFQFELAMFPLAVLMVWYWWYHRQVAPKLKTFLPVMIAGVTVGLLPQIIFDVTHKFQQLGLFVAWVGYRLLGFVGLTGKHTVSSVGLMGVMQRLLEYGQKFLAWGSAPIAIALTVILFSGMVWYGGLRIKGQKNVLVEPVALWILLLLLGYLVHGGPSEAYFPAFFVPVSLLIGWGLGLLAGWHYRLALLFILAVSLFNSWFLVKYDFLVATPKVANMLPQPRYGAPLVQQQEAIGVIQELAAGEPAKLIAIGPGSQHESFLDNYRFLLRIENYPLDEVNGVPIYIWSRGVFDQNPLVNAITYYVGDIAIGKRL